MMTHKQQLILIIDYHRLKILLFRDSSLLSDEECTLNNNEIIDGIIFNLTKIEQFIMQFIMRNQAQHIPITIIVSDSLLYQTLNQDLDLGLEKYKITAHELQFYPTTIIYTVGIMHYQLFQYHLLCSKLSITLISITTSVLQLHQLFKSVSHKSIDTHISTIPSLKTFFINAIQESDHYAICHSQKNFDTMLSIYD